MPIWYGQHYLYLPLSSIHYLPRYERWLRTFDHFALRCMKGVKLENYEHICVTWQGNFTNVETNAISFGLGMANVTEYYLGGCCKPRAKVDDAQDNLVRRFRQNVEHQPQMLKEALIVLLEKLRELNRERPSTWYW